MAERNWWEPKPYGEMTREELIRRLEGGDLQISLLKEDLAKDRKLIHRIIASKEELRISFLSSPKARKEAEDSLRRWKREVGLA